MTPAEVEEDIEIAMAAIEHRPVESLVKPMFAWAPQRKEKK
jgi:hypothetical protein